MPEHRQSSPAIADSALTPEQAKLRQVHEVGQPAPWYVATNGRIYDARGSAVRVHEGGGSQAELIVEARNALPVLLDEVGELRKPSDGLDDRALDIITGLEQERDTLQDDVLRFITQRNLACERLAARLIPGPDGRDDIDRRRLIQEVSEDAWDDVDGWQEMAAKGAMVIAERDRLRNAAGAVLAAIDNGSLRGSPRDGADAHDEVSRLRAALDPTSPLPHREGEQ